MKFFRPRKRHSESGTLNLPEMQAARDRRARRLRRFLVFGFFALFCVGALWLVVRSPLFAVRQLSIEGEEQISEDEIRSVLRSRIFGGSYVRHALGYRNLLIWPEELKGEDLNMFPLIKSLTIEKNYLRRSLVVRVSERVPLAIWCYERQDPVRCVWFDSEGVVMERALEVEGNLIRRVSDWAQEPHPMRALILPGQFVSNFFSIFSVLERSGLSLGPLRVEDLGLQEVKVKVREGPELMFSLRFPSHSALAVLESLEAGENLRGKKFGELEYVDFRVEHRAYFK